MSYILDALKKADAERERGGVPGLHSQPVAVESDDGDEASSRSPMPIVWIGAGVALCLIAVLSWQLLMREPASPAVVAVVGTPESVGSPPGVPQAPTRDAGQVPAMPAQEPQQSAQPSYQAPYQGPSGMAAPAPVAPPADAMRRRQATPPPAMPQTALPTTPQPSRNGNVSTEPPPANRQGGNANNAGSPPEAASQRVPTLQELPDDIRREIPQLTIGGAMYSETRASRMLIVNSQVFHEGDKPYQGLVLEEIRLKSAVFSYRGYRYLVNY